MTHLLHTRIPETPQSQLTTAFDAIMRDLITTSFALLLIPSLTSGDGDPSVNTHPHNIVLESTIVQCSSDEALAIPSPNNKIRLASSFKGPINFDLKLYSKCHKKLLITLKITDTSSAEFTSNAIVVLNEGQNSLTHKPSFFGLPLAIKFHQGKVFERYQLKYLYRVNAKMMEEIISYERNKSYVGCDNELKTKKPTCGFYPEGERQVAGFCCSCKDHRNHVQQRGGQRCDVPGKTEEQLTSAHCLRPSSYFYNVYELEPATLYQRLSLDVYRSEELKDGRITWHRMSAKEGGVHVDTYNTMAVSGELKVSYHPHLITLGHSPTVFNHSSQRLLVPVESMDFQLPDPLKGPPPSRMLVVPKSLMSPHGAQCDHVGSGINAFIFQKNPCQQESHSCLKNQPFDLWKLDQGPRAPASAKFRLSSFRDSDKDVPSFAAIQEDEKSGYLYAEHKTTTPTNVYIEVPADDIVILAPGYNAFIESVLTDTGVDGAKIVAHIMNKEVVPATFSVQLTDCSFEILNGVGQGDDQKITTPPEKIGPLGANHYSIDVHTYDITQTVYCFVLLVNEHGESIAAREITLHPKDTCLCVHTCKCSCGDETNLKCERLADENIIAAGLYSEILSPAQLEAAAKQESQRKTRSIFHWILALHIIAFAIGAVVMIVRSLDHSGDDEEKEKSDHEEEEDEEEDEEEEDYEEETEDYRHPHSARSLSEDSDVTLYKKKRTHTNATQPSTRTHDQMSTTESEADLRQKSHIGLSHQVSVRSQRPSQQESMAKPPSQGFVNTHVAAESQSRLVKSTPSVNVESKSGSQVSHAVTKEQSQASKQILDIGGGGQAVLYGETPSVGWGNDLNNNESNTENDIDAFLSFCATASSSRTSFGTYNRRKRDQYSAYDFLPESKHRGSGTWDY